MEHACELFPPIILYELQFQNGKLFCHIRGGYTTMYLHFQCHTVQAITSFSNQDFRRQLKSISHWTMSTRPFSQYG